MRLVFALAARRDLAEAVAYISADNPDAARRQRRLIERAAQRLLDFPGLGREDEDGRRRLRVPRTPFVLMYRQHDEMIVILRVWHGARQDGGLADRA
ncbi:type II toxin-antitoxin system RelE/ParE family toxin [Roseomonas sp. AR75]|uniref:type II toxin-antitoxin system RelE/ParE family toxin n=1 Tax=Roseomonas sp. AR75 TaxID=2562311 RepID=UPI0010C03712|nr:type II toxin-antitoxin system RelE/ParE family toxin [Roseomonas sp. AR75]